MIKRFGEGAGAEGARHVRRESLHRSHFGPGFPITAQLAIGSFLREFKITVEREELVFRAES